MEIQDTVAVVTGASSGLGRATAQALAAEGAQVVGIDLREPGDAAPGVTHATGDVRDEADVARAIETAVGLGPLRICVNCAGIGAPGRTVRKGTPYPLADFRRVIEVNLIGTFNVIRLAAAAMEPNEPLDGDRGVIVNTASIAAYEGQIGQASYAASKGGIASLTLPVARDLAGSQIRCLTIAPGIVDTPLLGELPDEVRASLAASVPHPARLGRPEEFAQLAVAAVRNPLLNGEVIRLDGALRMGAR
jgi:NAD(P)-dependent dehydrogenase (short-subunit alcohol dehydrogenase family)